MPPEKQILVIQHTVTEKLGILEQHLKNINVTYNYVKPFLGDILPANSNEFAGLIVLGGPQSGYQEMEYPYLIDEKRYIKQALQKNTPILGICLGSQLIAECLGSKIYPDAQMQIGWNEVHLSENTIAKAYDSELSHTIKPLHWHQDIYEIPRDSISLGYSKFTESEGFIYKNNVLGLLFHLEPTLDQIKEMIHAFPDDVLASKINKKYFIKESEKNIVQMHRSGNVIFSKWCALL